MDPTSQTLRPDFAQSLEKKEFDSGNCTKLPFRLRSKSSEKRLARSLRLPIWASKNKKLPINLNNCASPTQLFNTLFEQETSQTQLNSPTLKKKNQGRIHSSFSVLNKWKHDNLYSTGCSLNMSTTNNSEISVTEFSLKSENISQEEDACSSTSLEMVKIVQDIVEFIQNEMAQQGITINFDLKVVIENIVFCDGMQTLSLQNISELFGVEKGEKSIDRYSCFQSFKQLCF